MLKAIIVDDEAPARSELRFLLNEVGGVDVVAEVPYALYEQVVRIAEGAGAHVEGADFGAEVLMTLRMLDGTQEPLVEKLTELTRGQVEVLVSAPFDAVF